MNVEALALLFLQIKMFKPFDYWSMEKTQLMKENDQVNAKNSRQLKDEFAKIDDKTLLRHIKIAEHAHDSYFEECKGDFKPLFLYLTQHELAVLFQSYGFPKNYKKIQNYYCEKYGITQKDGEIKWKNLNDDEKNKIKSEHMAIQSEYYKKFFQFSRELPDKRVNDFFAYLGSFNPETNNTESKIPYSKGKHDKDVDSEEIKAFKSKYAPFEVFYEKNKDKFTEASSLNNRNRARKAFSALDHESKLKYIKKTEELFDKETFTLTDDKKTNSIISTKSF